MWMISCDKFANCWVVIVFLAWERWIDFQRIELTLQWLEKVFFLFCLLNIVMVKRTSVCLSVYVCFVVCASKRFVLLPRNVCFLQSSLDMFVQYSVWCYFLFIISGGTDVLISARYLKTVFFFLVILLLLFCFLVKVVLLPDLIDLTDSFHNYFCGEQLSLWCG